MIEVHGCTAPAQAIQATGSAAAVLPLRPSPPGLCWAAVPPGGGQNTHIPPRESGLRGCQGMEVWEADLEGLPMASPKLSELG